MIQPFMKTMEEKIHLDGGFRFIFKEMTFFRNTKAVKASWIYVC